MAQNLFLGTKIRPKLFFFSAPAHKTVDTFMDKQRYQQRQKYCYQQNQAHFRSHHRLLATQPVICPFQYPISNVLIKKHGKRNHRHNKLVEKTINDMNNHCFCLLYSLNHLENKFEKYLIKTQNPFHAHRPPFLFILLCSASKNQENPRLISETRADCR